MIHTGLTENKQQEGKLDTGENIQEAGKNANAGQERNPSVQVKVERELMQTLH